MIAGRLAVSQRIGGYGFQHRRVRREEEILWLQSDGKVNTVVTLLNGNQNVQAYEEAGFRVFHEPVPPELDIESDVPRVMKTLHESVSRPGAVVLVHRDLIDDTVSGLLAAYLINSKLLDDPIKASAVIQEILSRPLGPLARSMMNVASR
ncbi:MAG: hypothetical protein OEQ47_09090 [Acidimicrobiia bacterium]|nr:hypothetical protein [Acidimicrobiia bacterium]